MKKLLYLSFTLFTLTAFGQLSNQTVSVNGTQRTFIQYLPSGFNATTENLPVVFVLHGLGGTASQMTGAGMNFIADTARVIVVYPQGLLNSYNQASWNNGTLLSSTADDETFFNTLIDRYLANFNADPTRVYVSGFSMGGIMSHHLACALNNRIAAIGPMAGTMSTSDINSCTPAYATPVIHLHGTADGTVPYDSNPLPSLSLVPETMAFWTNVHGCGATYDSIRMPDTASDNITVDKFTYNTCSPLESVELWRLNGADHVYLYQPANDITEMIEIWRFFRKWQHTNPTTVGIKQKIINQFSVHPNPSQGTVVVKNSVPSSVEVYNTLGQKVYEFSVHQNEQVVNLKHLGPGLYLLHVNANGKTSRLVIE